MIRRPPRSTLDRSSAASDVYKRQTLIRNGANLGFAEGINRALRRGRSAFVALVNNDAVVDPGWLDPLVGALETHPTAGAAAPLVLFDRWFVDVHLHAVSYTHLRAHETVLDIVCRLLLEKTHAHIQS